MNEYDRKAINEKFLGSGDLLALKYSDGYIFLQVDMWEDLQFRPFDVGEIGPGSSTGFQRLENIDGDDILYVEEDDKRVLHASIGMAPAHTRRFTNYPESENRLRTFPNLTVPSAAKGSDYGFIDGDTSPYERPTDAGELFIPPDVHLDFDFQNPSENESISPKLNIRAREYHVRTIDPRRNANTVKRVMNPGSPIPIAPVGSASNQTRTPRNFWGVDPLTESQINNILGN